MKRLFCIFIPIFLLTACRSREQKVTAAVDRYVAQTFKQPGQFNKVEGISKPDTMATVKRKVVLQQLHQQYDSLRSIVFLQHRRIDADAQLKAEYTGMVNEYAAFLMDQHYDFEGTYRRLMAQKDSVMYEVVVAYSMKNSGKSNLRECYAYYNEQTGNYDVSANRRQLADHDKYLKCGMMLSCLISKLKPIARFVAQHG